MNVRNRRRKRTKEVSYQRNIAESEMKGEKNVKDPKPKGKNQRKAERRRAD